MSGPTVRDLVNAMHWPSERLAVENFIEGALGVDPEMPVAELKFRLSFDSSARAESAYSPGTCEYEGSASHTTAEHDAWIDATDTLCEGCGS